MDITPTCPMGLTTDDLGRLLPAEQRQAFAKWMRGQTVACCDGRLYDHASGVYVPTECAASPHGIVTYVHDFRRFISGLPVVDW